jgi:hypothetical protein
MSFQGLALRYIRFLGPDKEPADYKFNTGLNILWGSSDTGKTFLLSAIDYMLGSGTLKDIPQRVGYDRVLLGITVASGQDYTLQRSTNGGSFRRFDGLLTETPKDKKAGKTLSAIHTTKNFNNLSHWLLQQIGLDNKEILFNGTTGETKSLGFRALAHLCVILYPKITQDISPLYHGQYHDYVREYGVFKLLLTGNDDSAITPETAEDVSVVHAPKPVVRPEVLEQMVYTYEDELAKLTDKPEKLDDEEEALEEQIEKLRASVRTMEGQITETTEQRREVYDRFSRLTNRRDEISELQARFRLLDQQYTNDLRRLRAIEESGQFFVLRDPMPCPLCGALPEGQHHEAVCDGNVAAVTQAAAAEIAKIKILQAELHDTITSITTENVSVVAERNTLEGQLRGYQQQIDAALTPQFGFAQKSYEELIEKRANIRQAIIIYKRLVATRRRLDEPTPPQLTMPEPTEPSSVDHYISKSVLRDFSKKVENILNEWHFPNATDVYFDELTRDIVIGGRARGSRGAGLCAITYSAFTVALFDYCRSLNMPHPGFVVLDSPLLAYKEPKGEDEGIAGTDLKLRFYEHLSRFAGQQQVLIVDNTTPPPEYIGKAIEFTGNPEIPRYGLFPHTPAKN